MISGLHVRWKEALLAQSGADFAAPSEVHWPLDGRPRADLFAWANTELTKSASGIGYARASCIAYAYSPLARGPLLFAFIGSTASDQVSGFHSVRIVS